MADVKIDTEQVIATAKRIRNLNIQMRDGFSDVQSAISRLDDAWDSSAATKAMSKFNDIKNSYCDARYTVVDNFVAFLYQQIGEGYTQTEAINTLIANQFK